MNKHKILSLLTMTVIFGLFVYVNNPQLRINNPIVALALATSGGCMYYLWAFYVARFTAFGVEKEYIHVTVSNNKLVATVAKKPLKMYESAANEPFSTGSELLFNPATFNVQLGNLVNKITTENTMHHTVKVIVNLAQKGGYALTKRERSLIERAGIGFKIIEINDFNVNNTQGRLA